jgi:hypothetical protein
MKCIHVHAQVNVRVDVGRREAGARLEIPTACLERQVQESMQVGMNGVVGRLVRQGAKQDDMLEIVS